MSKRIEGKIFLAFKIKFSIKVLGNTIVAKTKTSIRGVQNKKIVVVKEHERKNGTKVHEYRRSTPN
ncbi:hypothetical protein EOL99_03785 [Candidatus Falkowbacteria bacterium]|nr:hypothetical protein [Candidatus Falkowbacteria bacterium]